MTFAHLAKKFPVRNVNQSLTAALVCQKFCVTFRNTLLLIARSHYLPAQPQEWRSNASCPSTTAYSIYSRPTSMSGGYPLYSSLSETLNFISTTRVL